jgi:hypothetical protein
VDYEITWGGDPEDVSVTTSGRVTIEELDGWAQEVLADPRYRPGLRVLVDHRGSLWDHLTPDDLRRRSELVARDAERIGPHRNQIAMVASRPVDYGLGRMLEMMIEARTDVDFQVFYDIDDARAWLREGRSAPPQA